MSTLRRAHPAELRTGQATFVVSENYSVENFTFANKHVNSERREAARLSFFFFTALRGTQHSGCTRRCALRTAPACRPACPAPQSARRVRRLQGDELVQHRRRPRAAHHALQHGPQGAVLVLEPPRGGLGLVLALQRSALGVREVRR